MGYESVIIFGHPCDYVEKGFVSCQKKKVCVEDGYFPTAMLVKELVEGTFDGRRWVFHGSSACEFDVNEALEYDKQTICGWKVVKLVH